MYDAIKNMNMKRTLMDFSSHQTEYFLSLSKKPLIWSHNFTKYNNIAVMKKPFERNFKRTGKSLYYIVTPCLGYRNGLQFCRPTYENLYNLKLINICKSM